MVRASGNPRSDWYGEVPEMTGASALWAFIECMRRSRGWPVIWPKHLPWIPADIADHSHPQLQRFDFHSMTAVLANNMTSSKASP